MKGTLGLLVAWLVLGASAQGAPSRYDVLCAGNPAFSSAVMLTIVQAQLQKDHDPSLDGTPADKLADEAAAQGVAECAQELQGNPGTYGALAGLSGPDLLVGWDAYNTACGDRKESKGNCIIAEVGSQRALKRMASTDEPAGAKALVQTCALVMQTDPVMAEWRSCVDQGLAVHASAAKAAQCKVSVGWHVAKTGDEAGKIVARCLAGK